MPSPAAPVAEPPTRVSRRRPPVRSRRWLGAALLGALLLVPLSCGGDDGEVSAKASADGGGGAAGDTDENVVDPGESGDVDEVRSRVADDFRAEINSGLGTSGAEVTDDQADCAAEGIIDALGVRRASELNETDEIRLSTGEAEKVVPVVRRCFNFAELLAEGIVQGAEGKISDNAAGCLAGELENTSLVDDALTAAMTGTEIDPTANEQSSKALLDAMSSCLSSEDLQKLGT